MSETLTPFQVARQLARILNQSREREPVTEDEMNTMELCLTHWTEQSSAEISRMKTQRDNLLKPMRDKLAEERDSLLEQLGRAHEEYRNLNAAYQQLSDIHSAASFDANRYRFLRLNWDEWTGNTWNGTRQEIADKLDAAIDGQAKLSTQ